MRIACDLDGVVADLHRAFIACALQLFPELESPTLGAPEMAASPPGHQAPAPAEPLIPAIPTLTDLPLTARQFDAVWRAIARAENFWESLNEIEPGAIRRLAALADSRGWEVLFVTSRPRSAGRTIQRQSQRWLEACGFPLPSVYVVHGSRGLVAKALQIDVVIDDRPDNCLDVVLESQAGAMLVWRGTRGVVPASARRMGIAVVPTVAECLEAILKVEQLDAPTSVLDRLRGLFRLKTTRNPVA
jgi:hypothetical protein